jgi:hypothetical protein
MDEPTIAAERVIAQQAEWAAVDEVGAETWWVLKAQTVQSVPIGTAAVYMRQNGFPTTAVVSEAIWFSSQEGADSAKENLFGIAWQSVKWRFPAEMVRMHKNSFHV